MAREEGKRVSRELIGGARKGVFVGGKLLLREIGLKYGEEGGVDHQVKV